MCVTLYYSVKFLQVLFISRSVTPPKTVKNPMEKKVIIWQYKRVDIKGYFNCNYTYDYLFKKSQKLGNPMEYYK